jgi:hypothetical protein
MHVQIYNLILTLVTYIIQEKKRNDRSTHAVHGRQSLTVTSDNRAISHGTQVEKYLTDTATARILSTSNKPICGPTGHHEWRAAPTAPRHAMTTETAAPSALLVCKPRPAAAAALGAARIAISHTHRVPIIWLKNFSLIYVCM